tara:strand:- start:3813 stop:4043 length:231 start_codon:yes stop_codon:yes gene_type:complete
MKTQSTDKFANIHPIFQNEKVKEALKEASVSTAILVEEVGTIQDRDDLLIFLLRIQKDLEHIQDQITILENTMEGR